jgi:TIR domain
MADKIFINYRREDSAPTAGRLHDRLAQVFGRKQVFMDVDEIPAGIDFVAHLNSQVAACKVLLVVIGPHWLDVKNEAGQRRLNQPEDFVAIEIAAALARDIRVIPVLVDGASIPKASELPDSLKPLVRRQAIEVRQPYFGRDAEALIERVREALGDKAGLSRWRGRPLAGAAALAVPLLIGVGGYVFIGHIRKADEAQQQRFRVPGNATQTFDASVVPLVTESVRASLAEYPKQPDAKALAISADSYGVSVGASSQDIAQREALDQCLRRSTTICRIYATGTTVSWSKAWIPLPASGDLRVEPLDRPLVTAELQNLLGAAPDNRYLGGADHRALAYTMGGSQSFQWFTARRSSLGEAVRQALERCGYAYQRQCMIVSVDGFLTVQIPKSRRITGLFMPATEPDMSDAARQRIAQIYQARDWRAVARGKSGAWYAIAAETSELTAVEAALKSCAQGDDVCSLYAIGNFRVSDTN